jgi:hypothetical protein
VFDVLRSMSTNMLEITITLIYFVIINVILLALFSVPFILPIIIRSSRLKKVAVKYGLYFESKLTKDNNIFDRNDVMRKNIITGELKGKKILIFDQISYRPIPFYTDIAITHRRGKNSYSFSQRKTFFMIDGIEKELKTSKFIFLEYTPVNVVEENLRDLVGEHH